MGPKFLNEIDMYVLEYNSFVTNATKTGAKIIISPYKSCSAVEIINSTERKMTEDTTLGLFICFDL